MARTMEVALTEVPLGTLFALAPKARINRLIEWDGQNRILVSDPITGVSTWWLVTVTLRVHVVAPYQP